MKHKITFTGEKAEASVEVATNTVLADAARLAGIDLGQPCGGQGRCGRCAVQVTQGSVRRRSTLRLSPADVEQGYALACQTVIEGDAAIYVPPQKKIERRLTTDRVVADVVVPADYDYDRLQTVRRIQLELNPPSMEDQTDDWGRLQTALRMEHQFENLSASLAVLQKLGTVLREGEWKTTVVADLSRALQSGDATRPVRLIDVLPGRVDEYSPLWGASTLALRQ